MHLERLSGSKRSHLMLTIACLMACAAAPAPARAQLGIETRLQMGFGGDRIATIEYSDGSESDLKLGTYFTIAAGPVLRAWMSGASSIELQALAGWSTWSTGPENTEDRLKLSHFPLEGMLFYGHRLSSSTMLRIGGGGTYHVGGNMSGSGSLEGNEADIENAFGYMGDISLVWGVMTAGVRYKGIEPTIQGVAEPLDGSSLGLYFGFTTPRK